MKVSLDVLLGLLVLSYLLGSFVTNVRFKISELSLVKDIKKKYNNLLNNLINNKTSFIKVFDKHIYLSTNMEGLGDVTIIYFIDNESISIFDKDKCLYVSNTIDEKLKGEIISMINNLYKDDINDVINVLGVNISRSELEFKIKEITQDRINEIDFIKNNINSLEEESEIDRIIIENESKHTIDSVLDKIIDSGYENLSDTEKDFLLNLNKN